MLPLKPEKPIAALVVEKMSSLLFGVVVPMPTLPPLVVKTVPPTARFEAKRFVELAVVAKKFVVVALVPVAFTKVKFWKVVDPV